MSTGFFETQRSRLDEALHELRGHQRAPPRPPAPARHAELLMVADHRLLIAELRVCRDALNAGVLRNSLTRLLARHERLAARLLSFASTS